VVIARRVGNGSHFHSGAEVRAKYDVISFTYPSSLCPSLSGRSATAAASRPGKSATRRHVAGAARLRRLRTRTPGLPGGTLARRPGRHFGTTTRPARPSSSLPLGVRPPLQGTRFGRARDAWRSAGRMVRVVGRGGRGRLPAAGRARRVALGERPLGLGHGAVEEAARRSTGAVRHGGASCLPGTTWGHRCDAWTTVAGW